MALGDNVLATKEWDVEEGWEENTEEYWTSPLECPKRLRSVKRRRDILKGSSRAIWDDLPPELEHITRAIHASRELLDLKDENDLPLFSKATWTRAVTFLAQHALWLLNNKSRIIEAPRIGPGPEESIDLHWEADNYELLVNIKADPNQPAGFYGDDRGRLNIKGTLDLSAYNEGLLSWLEKGSVRLGDGEHTR